jgi:hypothetical protein
MALPVVRSSARVWPRSVSRAIAISTMIAGIVVAVERAPPISAASAPPVPVFHSRPDADSGADGQNAPGHAVAPGLILLAPWRARARLPTVELDRARRLGVHTPRVARGASIYFAHARSVFSRDGMRYAYREGQALLPGETVQLMSPTVR